MGRRAIAAKNSVIGLISQLITTVLKFLLRSVFIQFLGVELLGINSTLVSVLNTLSLSELGFQTAVVYRMYGPLAKNDYDKINEIISIFKRVYQGIAVFFIVAGIVCLPLLPFIITGIELTFEIYLYFILLVINSAVSYLLAYKRTLLYADKKDYYSKIIDTVFNIVITGLKILLIIVFRNYILYLMATIFQTVMSNVIVHYFCGKLYPYLKRTKFSRNTFKLIFIDVKNVFASKIAGFIYSSTDNLLISIFAATVTVGYFVNYTTITTSLKSIINSALNPITPIIGNMLTDKDKEKSERVLFQYTFIRFILATAFIIPFIVLVQDFIEFWVGETFVLSFLVVVLLAVDLYIFLIHNVFLDYINGAGLFRQEKYIEIGSALINLILSIILVQFFVIEGVLVGTVVTQVYCWFVRSLLVYKKCFKSSKKAYLHYWFKQAVYITVFLAEIFICAFIRNLFLMGLSPLFRFIIGGFISEAVVFIVTFLVFIKTDEEKMLLVWIKKAFLKKRSKKEKSD